MTFREILKIKLIILATIGLHVRPFGANLHFQLILVRISVWPTGCKYALIKKIFTGKLGGIYMEMDI